MGWAMFNGISRWLRRQSSQQKCVEAQSEARAELEQRVSAQLGELIAYMDRLGLSREPDADARREVGAPH